MVRKILETEQMKATMKGEEIVFTVEFHVAPMEGGINGKEKEAVSQNM